ncbi:MAG TPA: hypothetical protein VFT57_02515 [Gemmatimonadaceae bacterium]|jgi:hypothetical protein|nr:hypothetical protein [Gemmatimonadaceae bacterium]
MITGESTDAEREKEPAGAGTGDTAHRRGVDTVWPTTIGAVGSSHTQRRSDARVIQQLRLNAAHLTEQQHESHRELTHHRATSPVS